MTSEFVKSALVTGASEGIGKAMVEKLLSEGFFVFGIARSAEKLQTIKTNHPKQFDYLAVDLADAELLEVVLEKIETSRFDVCVNNAGIGLVGKFTESSIEKTKKLLDLNINALVQISHSFLKNARRGDVLVNVSSVLAFMPMPNLAVYSATKSFVTAFSETLFYQYAPAGIKVICLHPGKTTTRFRKHAGGGSDAESFLSQTSEEVAEVFWKSLSDSTQPNVISGWKNQSYLMIVKWLPRIWVLKMMGKVD
jgi:short-subunit dehydrogenase